MELTPTSTGRYRQLFELHAQLQSNYETQKRNMIEYKHKAHYWEAQFTQLKSREELLRTEVEELKAQLRKREQQLFGKKSETSSQKQDQYSHLQAAPGNKKKKGQQIGSKGHGKRDYSHLPAVEETVELYEKDAICPCCQLAYEELGRTEDSEILEVIHVKPYRRLIRRKQYKRNCVCEKNPDPQIITPPPSERLIPKCKLGISIWHNC